MRGATAATFVLSSLLVLWPGARGQNLSVPPAPQDCGSVVVIKCDKPEPSASERGKREAARRIETRRADRATVELDRVIIESDAERPNTPEQALSRALSRAPARPGEHTFATGEGAQCTCRSICPPPPLACCACSDQPGSRLATAPGWKPTN